MYLVYLYLFIFLSIVGLSPIFSEKLVSIVPNLPTFVDQVSDLKDHLIRKQVLLKMYCVYWRT